MKKRTLSLIVLSLLIFSSCNNNDDDNTIETCSQHGLFYTLDSGSEVYLPQGGNSSSNTIYTQSSTNPGDVVLVHELGNGYLFQSSATTINQTSIYSSTVNTEEGSQLVIGNILSSPNPVDLNFVCLVNDGVVGGTIRYTFSGTFTENNTNHTISGQICAIIDSL